MNSTALLKTQRIKLLVDDCFQPVEKVSENQLFNGDGAG